jgi:hypothetical protein
LAVVKEITRYERAYIELLRQRTLEPFTNGVVLGAVAALVTVVTRKSLAIALKARVHVLGEFDLGGGRDGVRSTTKSHAVVTDFLDTVHVVNALSFGHPELVSLAIADIGQL